MAKKLLRSGSLDDFQTAGSNGQTVFNSARQIRETLRLQGLAPVADCLAIPQMNEALSRVDWYAPVEGKVMSWAAADETTRQQALVWLEQQIARAKTLSQRCQQSEKTALQLFGLLLSRAFSFPAANCVFLVDGKPVITFWGFIKPDSAPPEDTLEALRPVAEEPVTPEPEPEIPATPPVLKPESPAPAEPDTIPETRQETPSPEPLLTPAPTPIPVPEFIPEEEESEEPDVVVKVKKRQTPRRRFRLLAGLLAILLVLAGVALWLKQGSNFKQPPAPVAEKAPPVPSVPVIPAFISKTLTLPTGQAQLQPPPAPPPEEAKPAPVAVAVPADALVLPDNALKAGSTRFLNGGWLAQPVRSWKNGDQPALRSLRYQIQNNQGSVKLTFDNHTECKADVFTGLMPSGTLLIKSRSRASCNNSSHTSVPTVACKQGENNVATCSGYYGDEEPRSLTFKKVSK